MKCFEMCKPSTHSQQDQPDNVSLGDRQRDVIRKILENQTQDTPRNSDLSLHVAVDAVLRKRAWCVSEAWPTLYGALGDKYEPLFRDYAALFPYPPASSAIDGYRFSFFLRSRVSLDSLTKTQILSFELLNVTKGGAWLRKRILPFAKAMWAEKEGMLIIGLRIKSSLCLACIVSMQRKPLLTIAKLAANHT